MTQEIDKAIEVQDYALNEIVTAFPEKPKGWAYEQWEHAIINIDGLDFTSYEQADAILEGEFGIKK
jgi:predicted metalloenzyme YecM